MPVAYDAALVSTLDRTQHLQGSTVGRLRAVRSRLRGPSHGFVRLGIVAALAVAASACDTGDGKTLPESYGTLPPPTTTIEPVRDGVDTLASVPIEPLPDDIELPAPVGSFALTGPWSDGALIEPINTCDGLDLSPALSWTGVPEGTVELAITMLDESVGDGTPFVHWVMAGINPDDIVLAEGVDPLGAIRAINFFGDVGYGGPCPPPGDGPHLYRMTMYALNQQVELADGTSSGDLLGFIQDVAIASSDVTGTYER